VFLTSCCAMVCLVCVALTPWVTEGNSIEMFNLWQSCHSMD
jgi:hypothetical protein